MQQDVIGPFRRLSCSSHWRRSALRSLLQLQVQLLFPSKCLVYPFSFLKGHFWLEADGGLPFALRYCFFVFFDGCGGGLSSKPLLQEIMRLCKNKPVDALSLLYVTQRSNVKPGHIIFVQTTAALRGPLLKKHFLEALHCCRLNLTSGVRVSLHWNMNTKRYSKLFLIVFFLIVAVKTWRLTTVWI